MSLEKTLDLHLLPADAVCLVPMDFGLAHFAIGHSDTGGSLQLPPSAGAKLTAQSHDVTNASANGDRFDIVVVLPMISKCM